METVNLPLSLRELSDNLRNPLAGILGMARLLKSESQLTPEQAEYVTCIEQASAKLEVLANKLLEARNVN